MGRILFSVGFGQSHGGSPAMAGRAKCRRKEHSDVASK